MAGKDLKKSLDFVNENKEKLLKEHHNKYLLVYEGELIDAFDTCDTTAGEGVRQFGKDGNFLVCHLLEEDPVNFVLEAAI